MNVYQTKVGIVGLGFVGNAIYTALNANFVDLVLVDPAKGFKGTYEELRDCDGVFICVPSPQGDDGRCDTSILESVLAKLKEIDYSGVIISKCTAPPPVYQALQSQFKNLVHAPEFLTAANAVSDYINGTFSFIGGAVSAYLREAERLIRISQPALQSVIYCSIAEAALAKYTINSFLSTKVIFMNELADLSQKLDCDYDLVAKMIRADKRIGESHLQVPGPDGKLGFGGACFPKDTAALLKFANDVGADMSVLQAAVSKNKSIRVD